MAIREVLKMGDPRLLAVAQPVSEFGTPELENLLIDMRETMRNLNGAGLAAPQIGVGSRVVIFGFEENPRYPEAEPVPYTVLINPELTPIGEIQDEDWEGCLSVPGMRGLVPRYRELRYTGFDAAGVPNAGTRSATASSRGSPILRTSRIAMVPSILANFRVSP